MTIGNFLRAAACPLAGLLAASPIAAQILDPADPRDALEISKRLQCGVSEDEPVVYHWSATSMAARLARRTSCCSRGRG